MALIDRPFAPVAAPPPPKPPQLNIVASSIMPDVDTDTLGPGEYTLTAAGGWSWTIDESGRRAANKLPGETTYRSHVERCNTIIASGQLEKMSDAEMQQHEIPPGLTPESLPSSIFAATSNEDRWTGGYAYAPENQYPAVLADPCGQKVDLPGLPPPVVAGVESGTGGVLTAGTWHWEVTATNANGETLPSTVVTKTVTGTAGKVVLTWTQSGKSRVTGWNVYRKKGTGLLNFVKTVHALTYTDTGATATTGSKHPPSVTTTAGPGHYGNLPIVYEVPFLIQVADSCSAFGWSQRDYVGRALRLLDSATPNALEREFWAGAFAQNTKTGPMAGANFFLQQSDTETEGGTGLVAEDLTPTTAPTVIRGIQILEDYLANQGFGGQGVLHVAPETSPNLLGARRLGALLLSVMDNIIIPGSGYPTTGATGPAGAATRTPPSGQQWIYATDLTSVRLDAPTVYPSTLAEAITRGGGTTPNRITFRAERYGSVSVDGARLAATRVKLAS